MSDSAPDRPTAAHPEIFQRLDTTARYPYPFRDYARRAAWVLVQATLIRLSPPWARRWRRFWLRAFGAKMTDTSHTRPTTSVRHPWLLEVGEHTALSDRVDIYNLGPVKIGSHTVLSQDVYVCAGTHDYARPDLPLIRPTITIGSGVWVCAGAFIGPGVAVGDNSVIAARAVVGRDVPAGVVAGGNPCKVIKQRPMGSSTPPTP